MSDEAAAERADESARRAEEAARRAEKAAEDARQRDEEEVAEEVGAEREDGASGDAGRGEDGVAGGRIKY